MPEKSTTTTLLCPTCGSRLSETATRCVVCGSPVNVQTGKTAKAVQGARMPEITLSLPAALGLLALFILVGAVLVYFVSRGNVQAVSQVTETPTATITQTITATPTATSTFTPAPSLTPQPPIEYTIALGDNCATIAAFFKVSVASIVTQNGLSASCDNLIAGNKLLIPHPTPTASPEPSSTPNPAQATDQACEKIDYVVQDGDTLSSIARNYNVSMETIKLYNGLVNDVVYSGFPLVIPLCERVAPGTTPTPTTPPPYSAPNLLLPSNGAPFMSAGDVITLQWASVGTLRSNEAYAVTVEDITEGRGRKLVEYVSDTKLILPAAFRPSESAPHLIHWWVIPVRQVGTSNDGTPIWQPAGSASEKRGFIWTGGGGGAATATP